MNTKKLFCREKVREADASRKILGYLACFANFFSIAALAIS